MENSLNDKWLRLIGNPLSVPIATLAQMPIFYPGRWDLWWQFSLYGLVFTILMWEAGRWMILSVRQRWPGLDNTLPRVLWTLAGWLVVCAAGHTALLWTVDRMVVTPFKVFTLIGLRNNIITAFAFWAVLGSVYEAIYFFQNYRLTLQRTEQLRRDRARRQLEGLKNRVNPHFLFNSLTTLSALIGDNPRQAERFVDEMSKVYRYLLRANQTSHVTVGEELAFLRAYAFLLETRFDPDFSVREEVDPRFFDQQIFPTTLRAALDYWVSTQEIAADRPLHIRVSADASGLRLEGPYQPKTVWLDAGEQEWAQIRGDFEARGLPLLQSVGEREMRLQIPFLPEYSVTP
ncbi:MAG: histidine kinase [Saprospiraceae bacterium]